MTRYRWYTEGNPIMGELSRLQRRMSRLWEEAFPEEGERGVGIFPLANVYDDGENFFLTAEIPGVSSKDLDISIVSDSITIKGEREVKEEGDVNYHRRERSGGSFSRVVGMPDKVNPDKVEAKLLNGVLTVKLPRAEEVKPKQITIKPA